MAPRAIDAKRRTMRIDPRCTARAPTTGVVCCGNRDTHARTLLRFHDAVWTSFCSSSADAIDKERSSSDLSMGRWPVANCATAVRCV